MKRLLSTALVLLASCAPADRAAIDGDSAQHLLAADSGRDTAADTAADTVAIRTTLDGWYAAMQRVDSAEIVAPLTPEFLLLEDTLPLNRDQLVARLTEGDDSTVKWTAEFSDLRTRIVGNVAWTTLKNHEVSRSSRDGKVCQADFLETIVLVRNGATWRIDRYHAAALHRWKCVP